MNKKCFKYDFYQFQYLNKNLIELRQNIEQK